MKKKNDVSDNSFLLSEPHISANFHLRGGEEKEEKEKEKKERKKKEKKEKRRFSQ